MLADLLGLSRIGHPLGVSISVLSGPALEALCQLDACDVFVDSGAFSEVDREGRVVAPITDTEWIKRVAVMHRIATALGRRAVIVAPDRVGDQQETLRRLALFEDALRAIVETGARIVVPIQRGGMSPTLFHDAAACLVGPFTSGIPGNKIAMPAEELELFLRARRPRAVHLLGIGPKSRWWATMLVLLRRFVPEAELSCDSNGLACLVGRTNGRGGGPRPLTAAQARLGSRAAAVSAVFGAERTHIDRRPLPPVQLGLFDRARGRS